MTIKKTKVLLHMPHIFLHLAIGKVKTKQIFLNRLRVFLWEIEHNLLLGAIRPDVVIDLAVLPPPLEAHVIVDLEEVIAHLVVRQNLRSHENRRQRSVHPVPVVIVALHHLVHEFLAQPPLQITSAQQRTSGRSVDC